MVVRATLIATYVVVLLTFLLMIASAADMHTQKKNAKKKARIQMQDAMTNLFVQCGGCDAQLTRTSMDTLFQSWKPEVHPRSWRDGDNSSLYAATWVFIIIAFVALVLISYQLSLGFVDMYLSFPFRQWSLACEADRLASSSK